jgi:hypothetical protein
VRSDEIQNIEPNRFEFCGGHLEEDERVEIDEVPILAFDQEVVEAERTAKAARHIGGGPVTQRNGESDAVQPVHRLLEARATPRRQR